MTAWDPARTAAFFDDYGEREWTRFEDGRTPAPCVATRIRMLERYVRSGDRVLDAGCGPARFTLELRRLGALVTSPSQIEVLRQRAPDVDAHVLLAELDAELADDPALRGVGQHIIGVARIA